MRLFLLVAALACASCQTPTPVAPAGSAAQAYLQELIRLMEAHSLRRHEINWTNFRTGVHGLATGAQAIPDTFDAIEHALRLLADNHSSYRSIRGQVIMVRTFECADVSVPAVNAPSDVGYIKVGGLMGDAVAAAAFAENIQVAIRAADNEDLVGWIVDLRDNSGGNMWPMVAGLGPILGETVLGYFIDSDGAESVWDYRDGAARVNGAPVQTVASPYRLRRPRPRVAVLTNTRVVSSGEATTVAFRGRPDTRSFGTRTCGASTANRGFQLSDGAQLQLTVGVMADRTKQRYGHAIVPDEVIADPAATVRRAIAWLREGS